jgi:rhamnose utilization protein RhaD (predicted bifunctional aldolase and dehydrogenase)
VNSPEFSALRTVSAALGANTLLVQAAGGNTSIKIDDIMWIKASGTWLRDAAEKDIFVPLDLPRLTTALAAHDPDCESCTRFVRDDQNPHGLRPSIETSVHGLMPHRVVLHVHCINTIAHAVRRDARQVLEAKLAPFNWAFVPYARPGLQLSQAIASALRPGVDVLILENHGLAVAADTVAGATALLHFISAALNLPASPVPAPGLQRLAAIATATGYRLPHDPACHTIALLPDALPLAGSHAYYPDHVVFLGTEIPTTPTGVVMAVPGAGVLVRADAKPSIEPMLRCIGDVFRCLPAGAALKPLTADEIDQLLNWDAEKYRQTLKQV